MLSLEKPKGKPKMVCVLGKNDWEFPNSLAILDRLNSKKKDDLCTIVFDGLRSEPEVFEVHVDVFKNNPEVSLSDESITKLKEVLGTLEIKSNPELTECIRKSQLDKKKGRTRKYEDIARECGLRI